MGSGSLWPLLDSFRFLLTSFVVCACFMKVQNDEVAGFSWAPLILFGDGGLGGSACVTDLLGEVADANVLKRGFDLVGKCRTQMVKKGSSLKLGIFPDSLKVFVKSVVDGKNAHSHTPCNF